MVSTCFNARKVKKNPPMSVNAPATHATYAHGDSYNKKLCPLYRLAIIMPKSATITPIRLLWNIWTL